MSSGSKDWYRDLTGTVADIIIEDDVTNTEIKIYEAVAGKILYITNWWLCIVNTGTDIHNGWIQVKTGPGVSLYKLCRLDAQAGKSMSLSGNYTIPVKLAASYELWLRSSSEDLLVIGGLTGYEKLI